MNLNVLSRINHIFGFTLSVAITFLCVTYSSLIYAQLGNSSERNDKDVKYLNFAYGISGLPPFYFEDDKGQLKGLGVDLINRLIEPHGYRLKVVKQPRLRLPEQFRQGEVHIALYNPEWLAEDLPLTYTDPILYYDEKFLVSDAYSAEQIDVMKPGDRHLIKGRTVCTHRGYNYSHATQEMFSSASAVRVENNNEEKMLKMLIARRCDFILGEESTILWYARHYNMTGKINATPLRDTLWPVMVSLHTDYRHLVPLFNDYLSSKEFAEERESLMKYYLEED